MIEPCNDRPTTRQRARQAGCMTILCIAALTGGCVSREAAEPVPLAATVPEVTPTPSPQLATVAPAPAKASPPMSSSPSESSGNIDVYKQLVASSIHRANPQQLYEGAPPPMLKSIVVLSISIDPDGKPIRVNVMRTNGYRDLAQKAVDSVHQAAPLPRPHPSLLRRGQAEITESWLFRDDGRFQVRSIAQEQASSRQ